MPFGSGSDDTRSIALADFNNDSFIDIVTGNLEQENQIYFGDAEMTYKTSVQLSKLENESRAIDVGDFDKDGDIDILVGNSEQENRLYINHI